MSSIPVLDIESLSVEYQRRGTVIPAVQDFSLSIAPGETVGLVGESGSGKSTVALAILRLIRPQEGRITSGKILFHHRPASPALRAPSPEGGGMTELSSLSHGERVAEPGEGDCVDLLQLPEPELRSIRGRRIAMIFQDPFTSLNPVMTIREQMQEVIDAHEGGRGIREEGKEKRKEGREKGDQKTLFPSPSSLIESLQQVQLDPSRTLFSYPHQLSGGQRQRVAIAMALLLNPGLILADEPTTALDVRIQKDILDLLDRLRKELGFSMLLITHNLPLVHSRADRIVVMEAGRLVPEGEGAWERLKSAVHKLYA